MILKRTVLSVFAIDCFRRQRLYRKTRCRLSDMSWLSGCWQGRKGTAVLEEIWSKPSGGSMLGYGPYGTGEIARFPSNLCSFAKKTGVWFSYPQPGGGAARFISTQRLFWQAKRHLRI